MNPPAPSASIRDGALLRRRLADELAARGDLRTPAWRVAVESVPREVFAPEWFERVDTERGTMWAPVVGDAATLARVYEDVTLVTQLDNGVRPRDATGPVFGVPSSSTLPGLVVGMLVGDGPQLDHVLDVDGSFATLLPQRDGSWRVREGGPRRLWDLAERAAAAWRVQGSPAVDAFRLSITPDRQTVHLPDNSLTWDLPRG
ncbi:hypothetical protein [Embleya sp. NPDC020886]|uniref:hypothetical protein n=1 Tax=Embleya sp. NPDC020886 TaxID=3363980 RepID=UPI0037AA90C5